MAAWATRCLAVAAFAALLVLATCNTDGNLRTFNRKPRPRRPTVPVYTFGWASIAVVSGTDRSCDQACGVYGLAPVASTVGKPLCSFDSVVSKTTVFGTWGGAALVIGGVVVGADSCYAALADGTKVDSFSEILAGGSGTYRCGCCGAINRRGLAPACPASVVEFAPSAGTCSAAVAWDANAPPGGDGSKICLRTALDGTVQFGSIYDAGTKCNIWSDIDPLKPAWQKMCMKINVPP